MKKSCTELEKYTGYTLDNFLKLPEKAQQLLMIPIIQNYNILLDTEKIESPIEKIFYIAFKIYCEQQEYKEIYLEPQYKIHYNNKTYYADFVFIADDYLSALTFGKDLKNINLKLVIECDGFKFHHTNKKQVKKDNEREYDLKMAGFEVLRFSGTQIYNEPLKCAKNTYNYICQKIKNET